MFVGCCRLRKGIRGFHLDRIRHLEITGEVFPERDPAVLSGGLWQYRYHWDLLAVRNTA